MDDAKATIVRPVVLLGLRAHLDAELRAANGQPRPKERPGIITGEMVQRVIEKTQPRVSK